MTQTTGRSINGRKKQPRAKGTSRLKPAVRCAVYTRKSTEEGLEQEYNSLDAQRDAAEAYIKSQRHEGWRCLPDRYDDGGFTGANMDRPALRRLLADIEAGKIDCVVVYKVDRLSRSLLDFTKIMETFERHSVAFVSVTQAFNTATSMGRLVLNVLLSFAQFEREMIAERIRDKIAAARRKGKWSGGVPVLGYTVENRKLVVHPAEAGRVRQIFALYLRRRSLLDTAAELNRRGWTTKRWTTRKGIQRGGRPFTKNRLRALLTNVLYVGKIRHRDAVYVGEHEAIVTDELFEQVQQQLRRGGQEGGRCARSKHRALLRGLLRCGACRCAMSHAFTSKCARRYRYYVCCKAQQRGWSQCPAPSVPAGEIERFVVEQIECIGRDRAVVAETVRRMRQQIQDRIDALARERRALANRRAKAADPAEARNAQRRLTTLQSELARLRARQVDQRDAAAVLAKFGTVFRAVEPNEQARLLELLIEQVQYDGAAGRVALTFRPCGIRTLRERFARQEGEEPCKNPSP